jgi:hypothetical protein
VAGNANLGASFLNASVDNSIAPPPKQSSLLPDIKNKSSPAKRGIMMGAAGDDNLDGQESKSEESDSEAAYANADVDRDFAYLRYHIG